MNEENRYAPPKAEVADLSEGDAELASLGLRLGGAIIDGIISWVVMFPLMFVTGFWSSAMAGAVNFGAQLTLSAVGILVFSRSMGTCSRREVRRSASAWSGRASSP